MRELSYAQAISEGLVQAMERDPQVFIFGLGVDDWKGIFGTTKTAFEKFGPARVFDTPASEGALTGIALGAAYNGKRPVLVHARNDFMFLALDQMINTAAKWKYVYAGQSSVPIVIRSIVGKGWGQGATHSQSIQSVLAHFPGIYVAMPSSPYIAKGLILKSLRVDAPVVLIEHRSLYDDKQDVPEGDYEIDFGRAHVARKGKDITIVATSLMVRESLKAAELLSAEGIDV
ncbi:MAG: transketolase C-terminal domain-containing protein, partial [Candidatus Omnitrophota bacterium]